jgi:hypothetical protein
MACTLTGLDEWTDLDRVLAMSRLYTFVEWGVLYSPARQGLDKRYPSFNNIRWISRLREMRVCRLALHVCGVGVNEIIGARSAWLDEWLRGFGRVQLNLRGDRFDSQEVADAVRKIRVGDSLRKVIVQVNQANMGLCRELNGMMGLEFLWDSSGGRGVVSQEWAQWGAAEHSGISQCLWGYAGGLGPCNVQGELPKIATAANGRPFWIDMEQKLRSEADEFDLAKAQAVLEAVEEMTGLQRAMKIGY